VVEAVVPGSAVAAPPTAAWLEQNAASDKSVAHYLAAGESLMGIMDLTWKLLAGLFVLVLVAWAIGVLPGAVPI
jgi:hypothetical protein